MMGFRDEAPSSASVATELTFWKFQAMAWTGYGLALLLPWVGEFPVALMVPNKIVIAGTGLLVSTMLRELYKAFAVVEARLDRLVALAIIASSIGAMVWSVGLAAMLGETAHLDWRLTGSLDAGIPRLQGALYHALVLLTWSFSYLAIARLRASQSGHPLPHRDAETLVVGDGGRSLVLKAGEIDWVEAAGDYVRIHTGAKSVLLRGTMTQYESTLSEREYVRIHRSTIVNVASVHELFARPNKELLVVLRDGTKLRASRTYATRLRELFARPPRQR